MSYPKKLLRLRPTKGLASDTPANEVGPEYYTTGRNVHFRKGFAGRIGGNRAVYGTLPVDPVLHLQNVQINDTNFWIVFGEDEVHALETSNVDEITPSETLTAVDAPWKWSSALLNGVPIASNGVEEPMYWDGNVSHTYELLPDWTATESAKSIAVFKYHVFAMDIDGPSGTFPSLIKWSDAAEPGTVPDSWTPAADNEAGSVELSDSPGPVLCAVPLAGSLLVYKRSATYLCEYVGGIEKFTFRKVLANSGALTRRSVCDVNGQHFVVTDGDIILTDGTNRLSVAQGRMKEFLFNQIDQDHFENLFVTYNRAKNEVIVAFPESGSEFCTLAIVYDVANDAFGVRTLAEVTCAAIGVVNDEAISEAWDDDSGAWDDDTSPWNTGALAAAVESLVFGYGETMDMQDTDDAVSIDSSVGRYDLHFGEPERLKFVKRLHVRTSSGSGTLLVRVGARMTATDTITWSNEITLTEPEQIVNVFAQGRFISVEARSTGTSVWTVTGIDVEAELRGYF